MVYQLSPDVRAERERAIRPLFAYLEARGIKQNWLAKRMEISAARLWNYAHGINPPPDWFIPRACEILGIPEMFLNLQLPATIPTRRSAASQSRESKQKGATDGRNSSRRPRHAHRELAAQGA